ncbi:MAG: D-alanine--D-alanine ligase [Desulfobacterales bacterium]
MMTIGLTYDLRSEYIALGYNEDETAEFDQVETIFAIENSLKHLGLKTDRIGNAEQLIKKLVQGCRWDMVFNIAEGLYGFGREALVPSLLDAYKIPYTFSDPMVLGLTLHKAMTKHVIRDLGIPTPDFALVETQDDIQQVSLSFPLFAKPVSEGTGKGISSKSKITCREDLYTVCTQLLHDFRQPVLIERFLPGREFTAGILKTGKEAEVIGIMEIFLKDKNDDIAYSLHNKEHYEHFVEYRLVDDMTAERAKKIALAAWRGLGCRDAGRIDLRMDNQGVPNFIEVNPLAGIRPGHSDLCILCDFVGISYTEMIAAIVDSAMKRAKKEMWPGNQKRLGEYQIAS